ncbi:MAG: homocysteine S-methyltransferase family protein [Collinsella sp.]
MRSPGYHRYQRQYVEAGCDVITANTFGANAHKLDGAATVADVFAAAVAWPARPAPATSPVTSAPSARCSPLGTLSFDEAYNLFAEECAPASMRAWTSLLSRP